MSDEKVIDFRGGRGFRDDDGAAEKPIPDCPIVALGQNDGTYVFISPCGEKRELSSRELRSDAGQISLFDGDTTYLKARWPRRDKDGHILDDFNAKHAHAGLVAMCAGQGMWDPETPIRGRGVWRGPEDRLICHSGDRILLGGIEGDSPAGLRLGGAIYPRRPMLEPPAIEPAPALAAREWREGFTWWRFRPLGLGGVNTDRGPDGLAAELLFDASALALLGAGPRWRVHPVVKAVHGAGKSTLLAFIRAALGPSALAMNNFSEAGLRNSLANEARPVLLDEAEGDDSGVMSSVIRLIRQMSGNEGVQAVRGDGGGGETRHFDIAGSAFLFCINMPVLLPQDLSRMLVLSMLPAIPAHEQSAYDAISRAAELSPALRARALQGWDRFRKNLVLMRAALVTRGCTTRQADLLGGLRAAGAMMLDDRPLDPGAADDLAEAVAPLIETMRAEEADNSDARRCWLTLITRRADVWRGGEGQTIGSMLQTAQEAAGVEARNALNDYCGLRLVRPEDIPPDGSKTMPEAPCLYVTNKHEFLRTAYRETTAWRDGGWAHSLARLPGAAPSAFAVRIGGIKQRAVAIPLKHLPRRDRDDDEPPE